MMVPAVFAVRAKMPTGAILNNRLVILEKVVDSPLSSSTKCLFRSSPISANPNSKQNRTMAGMRPSEREWNGFEGIKSSMRFSGIGAEI